MNTCEHDFDYILDGNWECTKCAAEFSDEDKKDWQYQHLEQQLTQAQQTIEEQKELAAKYAEINRECEEEILSLESVIQTLKQQLGESESKAAWEKVTKDVKIKKYDYLYLVGKNIRDSQFTQAKDIVDCDHGDEIIIDKEKNKYFIVSMYLEGKSWVKDVFIIRPPKA